MGRLNSAGVVQRVRGFMTLATTLVIERGLLKMVGHDVLAGAS